MDRASGGAVRVVEYRTEWVADFEAERDRLAEVFSGSGAAIEHIGSTAVPGLAAKPIIDVLVGVERLEDAEVRIEPLRALGYEYVPEYEREIPDRRYFRRPSRRPRTHHLHCVEHGGRLWRRHLAFRDRLRASPEKAAEYGALKRSLASAHPDDRTAYLEGKDPFIRRILGALATLLTCLFLVPAPSAAQTLPEPTVFGVVAGYASTAGLWKPDADDRTVGGAVLGGYADARTPLRWLSIRVEVLWSQRGSDVVLPSTGPLPLMGGVRADYLTFSVRPRATREVGPARLHVAAGPVFEQLVRERVDATLGPTLNREVATVFGVLAGAGVGTTLGGRWRVELEGRVYEGLSDAFSGDFVSARMRSFEAVARVGIPRPRR